MNCKSFVYISIMKSTLTTILLVLSYFVQAQVNHEALYNAYLAQDFQVWKKSIDEAQKIKMTIKQIEEIINYEYGYIGVCLDENKNAEAVRIMQLMDRQLTILERHQYQPALVYMYRSALDAFQISLNKWDILSLGARSVKYADLAYHTDPQNPLIVSLKGNVDFFRPKLLGGSKKNALYNYEKAIELFEQQNQTTHNWNYLATLLWMAQAYEKTGNVQKAELVCQKILTLAPNFKYVKEVYYPELTKKMAK